MISRFLAWGTSLFILLLILELGMRLIGQGPPVRITQPDAMLGWMNVPDGTFHRATSEFDVRFTFNDLGLRDDEITAQRAPGEKRIVVLGDSFVLGYTVDRKDHFVDLLEARLAEIAPAGTRYQVVNAGVEGFSTDQEVLLLERLVRDAKIVQRGDVVVLCMYQNDLYWNDQPAYGGAKKPLLPFAAGDRGEVRLETATIDTQRSSWLKRNSAIANLFAGADAPPMENVPGVGEVFAEWGVFLRQEPAYITRAVTRTEGILIAFHKYCEREGFQPLVALVPDKVEVSTLARDGFQTRFPAGAAIDPMRATSVFADACRRAGIDGVHLLDPLNPGEGEPRLFARDADPPLHYEIDWHFSPEGNRRFADALAHRLRKAPFSAGLAALPARPATVAPPDHTGGVPTWLYVIGTLWLVLSVLYVRAYCDEKAWLAPLKVAALLAFIVLVFNLVSLLGQVLPRSVAHRLPGILVGLILAFVLWSVRKKLGTIFELFGVFIDRGHWYMVPLLTILLSIGTLLIVAASNPFVAPFIYTLF